MFREGFKKKIMEFLMKRGGETRKFLLTFCLKPSLTAYFTISILNFTLCRALGQGAFGEVYQGILKNKTDSSESNVAVKTLPELSTNQGNCEYTFYSVFLYILLQERERGAQLLIL